MELLLKYFPELTTDQRARFSRLQELYAHWNEQINVISRKDLDQLYVRHVLHSLAIARFVSFKPGTRVLDFGTGGGFPGIPLAIMFPECEFMLVDSIGKKIKVVYEIATALGLENVTARQVRVEELKEKFDFAVCRAVKPLGIILPWLRGKILHQDKNSASNGLIALKGGDLSQEIKESKANATEVELITYFDEEFFETKKLVYVPL